MVDLTLTLCAKRIRFQYENEQNKKSIWAVYVPDDFTNSCWSSADRSLLCLTNDHVMWFLQTPHLYEALRGWKIVARGRSCWMWWRQKHRAHVTRHSLITQNESLSPCSTDSLNTFKLVSRHWIFQKLHSYLSAQMLGCFNTCLSHIWTNLTGGFHFLIKF